MGFCSAYGQAASPAVKAYVSCIDKKPTSVKSTVEGCVHRKVLALAMPRSAIPAIVELFLELAQRVTGLTVHLIEGNHILAIKACIGQSEKNLLSSNISPTCPYNMVNFGPLAAEIVSLVCASQQISTGFAFWRRYCTALY